MLEKIIEGSHARFQEMLGSLTLRSLKCTFEQNILIQFSFMYLNIEVENLVLEKDNPTHCKLLEVSVLLLAPPSNTSWTLP